MTQEGPQLHAQRISRRFGYRYAVRDVTFELNSGDTLLLAGPNGAGKTTLLRLLAGLMKPSSGQIERRGAVGLVGHHSMLYDGLTARENLRFFSRLHGLEDEGLIDELLNRLGLGGRSDERIVAFSRGMVQRLAIARALLSDPQILLLDEPLSHLDELGARTVREVLETLQARGRVIVLVSHQLGDVIDLATAVGWLAGGRLSPIEPRNGRSAAAVSERFRALAHG